MTPEFEHEAVEWLADFAEHWADAPMLGEPAISAVVDQFAAATHENMHANSGMTEGERIAFGLGYMMAATRLHDQIEESGLHDDNVIGSMCEVTGLFAGTVAAKALDP